MGTGVEVTARKFTATMTHTLAELRAARASGEFVVTTHHAFLMTLKRLAAHFLSTCDARLRETGVAAAHAAILAEFDNIRTERTSYLKAVRVEKSKRCFGEEAAPWTALIEPLRERLLAAFDAHVDVLCQPGTSTQITKEWILCQRAAIFACYTLPSTTDEADVFNGVSAAQYPARLDWGAILVDSETQMTRAGTYLIVGADGLPTKLVSNDKVSGDLRWGARQERVIDGRLQAILARWIALTRRTRATHALRSLFITPRHPAPVTAAWLGKEITNIGKLGNIRLTNTELRKAFARHFTPAVDLRKRQRLEHYARHRSATDDAVYNTCV